MGLFKLLLIPSPHASTTSNFSHKKVQMCHKVQLLTLSDKLTVIITDIRGLFV